MLGSVRQIFSTKRAVFANHSYVSDTGLQGELKKKALYKYEKLLAVLKIISLIFSVQVSTKAASYSAAAQFNRGREIIVYYDYDLFKLSVMLQCMKSL